MRDLVYTCVFGNYDWVLPPINPKPGVRHILITDLDGPAPAGWERRVVDPDTYGSAAAANRYWKILGHRELSGFDRLLYIDANIRLLGDSTNFLDEALPEGVAIGLFRHPLRNTIAADALDCVQTGKVPDPKGLSAEIESYRAMGFLDDQGLSENAILARRPNALGLDFAMQEWWDLYRRHAGRDQISLPFVRWKTGLKVHWIDWSFREPNPWFAIYSHRKRRNINPRYAFVEAHSHDSIFYAAILRVWRGFRAVRRNLRMVSSSRRS